MLVYQLISLILTLSIYAEGIIEIKMTPRPASTEEVILGCIAFTVWWFLAVFPKVPFLPIGRTAGSLLGASLMVLFRVISPRKAFASVDLSILTLLFGTMILTGYLERADLFRYLGYALSWRSKGGTDLLCRLSLLAALSSAIFTNDTTCVVLTQFVMMLCREKNLPPDPFLIALACSANIGSAGTLIGNPQNLVIAQQSRMGFRTFSAGVMPAVAIGLAANTLGLYVVYRKWLSQPQPAKGFITKSSDLEQSVKELDGDLPCLSRSQSTNEHSEEISLLVSEPIEVGEGIETSSSSQILLSSPRVDVESPDPSYGRVALVDRVANAVRVLWRPSAEKEFNSKKVGPLVVVCAPHHDAAPPYKQETWLWKICVYMVTLGMLVAFLSGMDLPWSALMSAMVLMVLDWRDAGVSLNKVSILLCRSQILHCCKFRSCPARSLYLLKYALPQILFAQIPFFCLESLQLVHTRCLIFSESENRKITRCNGNCSLIRNLVLQFPKTDC